VVRAHPTVPTKSSTYSDQIKAEQGCSYRLATMRTQSILVCVRTWTVHTTFHVSIMLNVNIWFYNAQRLRRLLRSA
jgi:hypothetical protein